MSIQYNAYVIICDWRYAPFNDRDERFEALQFIRENNVHITVNETIDYYPDNLKDDDYSIPIRIMLDKSGADQSDDWSFSSVIKELDWAAICRYWPKSWFYDDKGELAKTITIHYTDDIDINLQVVKPTDKVMKESFADVIISMDKDILTGYDKSIKIVEEALKTEDNNMFKNKKTSKITIPDNKIDTEVKVDEDILPVYETTDSDNKTSDEKAPATETSVSVEKQTESTGAKKSRWLYNVKRAGVAIVAIATGVLLGHVIVKFANGDFSKSSK